MINTKLLANIFRAICLIALILLLMNSCVVTAAPKERLQALDKSQFFSKKNNCVQLQREFDILVKEYKQLEKKYRLLEKLDADKMKIIKQLSEKK
jgi:Na+/phosphate symporter